VARWVDHRGLISRGWRGLGDFFTC
jgi:hypothetical protein